MRLHRPTIMLLLLVQVALMATMAPVRARAGDLDDLMLTEEPDDLERYSSIPHPASLTAESTTVITRKEIDRLNPHTLADILQTVPGFQLLQVQGPGSRSAFSIGGAFSVHIQVLIDGVSQNLLGAEESAELGRIPASRIDRVEIIKGPASTAYGPALGGVVNVITKSPAPDRKVGGMVSASYGEGSTSDLQAEVSGTNGRFGYYLNGGSLKSSGVMPANSVVFNHAYAKLGYDLPGKGALRLSLDFREGDREFYRVPSDVTASETDRAQYLTAVLNGRYPYSDILMLEMNAGVGRKQYSQNWRLSSEKFPQFNGVIFDPKNSDEFRSFDARMTLGDNEANIVAGAEYQHNHITDSEPVYQFPFLNFNKPLDRIGAYLNGTYVMGPVTILPGIRLDSTDTSVSYHLGLTVQLAEDTLFRVYGARGYSQPIVNFGNRLQHIQAIQGGIETSRVPYLWLKGTIFYSDTWHIFNPNVPADYPKSPVTISDSEQDRFGYEIEAQTVTFHGLSLKTGYTYADVRQRGTDALVNYVPIHSLKLGLNYDNTALGLTAALTGNYVTWPMSTGNQVTDEAFLWELHMNKKFKGCGALSPEVFLSVHNLFNDSQYIDNFQRNTPRWVEGGIRLRF